MENTASSFLGGVYIYICLSGFGNGSTEIVNIAHSSFYLTSILNIDIIILYNIM